MTETLLILPLSFSDVLYSQRNHLTTQAGRLLGECIARFKSSFIDCSLAARIVFASKAIVYFHASKKIAVREKDIFSLSVKAVSPLSVCGPSVLRYDCSLYSCGIIL